MSRFKGWCEKVMPFVVAVANGEVIQASCDNGHTWFDMDDCEVSDPALQFDFGDYDYRIKQRTIKIGDFDVPEPMRVEPEIDSPYFVVSFEHKDGFMESVFSGDKSDMIRLGLGICHKTKESAMIHAKAIISLVSAK